MNICHVILAKLHTCTESHILGSSVTYKCALKIKRLNTAGNPFSKVVLVKKVKIEQLKRNTISHVLLKG